jgi:hypothetical protein
MILTFNRIINFLILTVLLVTATKAISQKREVSFLQGTSGEILSAHFERESALLFTLDKSGFITTWDVNNMYPIRRFFAVPSVIFKSNQWHQDRKMIIATTDKIWVYDVSDLQTEIIDAYDRISGKYMLVTPEEITSFKNSYVVNNANAPEVQPRNLESEGKGQTKFGNYTVNYSNEALTVLGNNGAIVKDDLKAFKTLGLHSIKNIYFLTEDVLLIAGTRYATHEDIYNIDEDPYKSALLKFNWKTGIVTSNRSNDKRQSILAKAELQIANDSTLYLKSSSNLWIHQLTPAHLANKFYGSSNWEQLDVKYLISKGFTPNVEYFKLEDGQSRLLGYFADSYPSGVVYRPIPYTNTEIALVGHNSDGSLGDVLFYKHIQGFVPLKLHSNKKFIIWKSLSQNNSEIIVSNFDGRVLARFTGKYLNNNYLSKITFSPDGKWLTLMKDGSEIMIYNTSNFKTPISFKTGLQADQHFGGSLQFNAQQSKLAYTIYNPLNFDEFILAVSDLTSQKQDTLLKGLAIPDAWCLNKNFDRAALYYPINLADTSFFNNKQKIEEAVKYKLRNIYSPSVLIFRTQNAKVEQVMSTTQQNPILQMAFMGEKILTLQQDGMLHYYDINNPNNKLTHWVFGQEQAILANERYYATPGMIDFMLSRNKNKSAPVGEQDVELNAPHKIISLLDSSQTGKIKLYKMAYEKRLSQYTRTVDKADKTLLPEIDLAPKDWQDLNFKSAELNLNLLLKKPHTIQKIFVRVNGVSIYGKEGFNVKDALSTLSLNIPLDSGYNEIRIQAIDKQNNYSNPINIEHVAKYTYPKTSRKLWILAAGVSIYADSTFNLKYAAKDAHDFVNVFKYKEGYTPEIITITDKNVTTDKVLNALKNAKVGKNDVVLLYLAGHGLLNNKGEFYFATQDMDFQRPEAKGLSYAGLMDAMERMPARQKVLLLDACNSGLLDRTLYHNNATFTSKAASLGADLVQQNIRGVGVLNKKIDLPDKDVFLFMQKTFSDFSQDNNISILSAALGNSYALEYNHLQNGLFTYALIKGLGLAKAATTEPTLERKYGESSVISIRDLANYLNSEVKALSNGAQVPTFSLSKNAAGIIFSEPFIIPAMEISSYKTSEKPDELSDGERYKLFLDRYKQ